MFKYTPLYSNGKEPNIEENDIYRIEIPYVPLFSLNSDTTQKNEKTAQKTDEFAQNLPRNCPENNLLIRIFQSRNLEMKQAFRNAP